MTAAADLLGVPSPPAPADDAVVGAFRDLIAGTDPLPGDADLPKLRSDDILSALVAVVPDALARHRRTGIPAPMTRATLLDVGRKHRLYGADTVLPWLLTLLRGDVVDVGRLQVERVQGEHGFGLHVPEKGPLLPADVDASLGAATELTGATRFSCTSWLLDPVVQTELPASNIAAFAKRFDLASAAEATPAGSAAVCRFVFRRPVADVLDCALVVPRSRLELLVAGRLCRGDGWAEPTGILRL